MFLCKVDFLLKDFEKINEAIHYLLIYFYSLSVEFFELGINILCQVKCTHCMFAFEFTIFDNVITENTSNFLISFIFKLKVFAKEFYDFNVFCIYSDDLWDKFRKLFYFSFG